MENIKVSIVYLSKDKQKKGVRILVNDGENVGELLGKLCEKLDLPESDEGGEIEYVFFDSDRGKALSKDETFADQDVQEGAILLIKVKKRTPQQAVEEKEIREITEEKTDEEIEDDPDLLCPICKGRISKDDTVCKQCGQRLVAKQEPEQEVLIPAEADETIEPEHPSEKTKKPKKNSAAFLIALITLLVVFLTLAGGAVLEKKGIINVFTYVRVRETTTAAQNEPTSEGETTTQPTTVDESQVIVEVTIKGNYLDEGGVPSEKLTQEQIDLGYTGVVVHSDGSVTYKIKKTAWQSILDEFSREMRIAVDETVQAHDYIEKITYSSDFSRFYIFVDREGYEADFDNTVFMSLNIGAGYYQMFALQDPRCTFSVYDSQSGDLLNTIVYPTNAS